MKRATKDEKKMLWLGENEAFLEATYPGMWVAIDDEGLAGVGPTLGEAEDDAIAKGRTDVIVVGVKKVEYQGVYLIRTCL